MTAIQPFINFDFETWHDWSWLNTVPHTINISATTPKHREVERAGTKKTWPPCALHIKRFSHNHPPATNLSQKASIPRKMCIYIPKSNGTKKANTTDLYLMAKYWFAWGAFRFIFRGKFCVFQQSIHIFIKWFYGDYRVFDGEASKRKRTRHSVQFTQRV